MFDAYLNPLFAPLLRMSPFWAVVIISFIISLATTLVYMLFTDQKLMKQLRDEIKHLQEEMKKHKNDTTKMMQIQNQAMEKNMKYMMHSMKVTLITFLPLILIFGWLNNNLAFDNIHPGEPFNITVTFDKTATGNAEIVLLNDMSLLDESVKPVKDSVSWTLNGTYGDHSIDFRAGGKTYTANILISTLQEYSPQIKNVNDNTVKSIIINYKKKIILDFLGMQFGWLGSYIIFSLIFSSLFKKIFNVH